MVFVEARVVEEDKLDGLGQCGQVAIVVPRSFPDFVGRLLPVLAHILAASLDLLARYSAEAQHWRLERPDDVIRGTDGALEVLVTYEERLRALDYR